MNETLSALSRFHLTGRKSGKDIFDITGRGLRPALFSAYGDLTKLRYDYPLVLERAVNGASGLRSLADIVSGILHEIAPPGIEGERLRQHVLRLERQIRLLCRDGYKGSLRELWIQAADGLRAQTADADDRVLLAESLESAFKALSVDGEVLDYDGDTPGAVLGHVWSVVQEGKARTFVAHIDELVLKLSNILKADAMHSATAYSAAALKQAMGSSYEAAFDFDSMSDIVGTAFVDGALPEKRRRRIRSVLSTLKSQKFFPQAADGDSNRRPRAAQPYVFDSCASALAAFRKQLPKMVELNKALTLARLEVESRYRETVHEEFFRNYDERFLESSDLASFPCYLIHLGNGHDVRAEMAGLAEILTAGLPFKVLAENDDIAHAMSIASGQLCAGARGSQLAMMALGLEHVFVLQASGADLYRLREPLLKGLRHGGPALFSVYTGRGAPARGPARNSPDTPAYLRAAAATESRAFPAIVHDPAAAAEGGPRVSIDVNPQPQMDWPVHHLDFEDERLQRQSNDIHFNFADFAAIENACADAFAGISRDTWIEEMLPLAQYLDLDDDTAENAIPYILMVDDGNRLHRVIVEARMVQAVRRCRESWRRLRELASVADAGQSPAVMAEPQTQSEPQASVAESPPAAEAQAAAESAAEPDSTEEVSPAQSDEPYIETPRCTTCEECMEINNRMFLYDDNKQAYIADLSAGSYRQLVEAAESCQVAIIHPGKPWNSEEPDLEALMARAEPFN